MTPDVQRKKIVEKEQFTILISSFQETYHINNSLEAFIFRGEMAFDPFDPHASPSASSPSPLEQPVGTLVPIGDDDNDDDDDGDYDKNNRRHHGEVGENVKIASRDDILSNSCRHDAKEREEENSNSSSQSQQKYDHDSLNRSIKYDECNPKEIQGSYTQSAQKKPPITIPRSFYCPLTLSPMIDPVIDLEGNSYERSAILHYLVHLGHDTSPITRNPLRPFHLAVNRALKELIHEFMG